MGKLSDYDTDGMLAGCRVVLFLLLLVLDSWLIDCPVHESGVEGLRDGYVLCLLAVLVVRVHGLDGRVDETFARAVLEFLEFLELST